MRRTPQTPYAEKALDSNLPIIDAHHHLAPGPIVSYGPQHGYLLDRLTDDMTAGHDVRATVYVECGVSYRTTGPEHLRPVGETEWVLSQRRPANHTLAAIVGYADVRLGTGVAPILDAHQDVAGEAFAGIRTRATSDPSLDIASAARRGLLASDEALAATAELARRGLIFEAWVYFHQLGEVARLASAQPELVVIVNHLGSPLATGPYAGSRAAVLDQWRAGLRELARLPNVVLKLGGIGMQPVVDIALDPGLAGTAPSSAAIAAHWAPEFLFCIDLFGPERCMFESNFPVDSYLCDYSVLWNAFKRATARLSHAERAALFHDTAMRVYRLPDPHLQLETTR